MARKKTKIYEIVTLFNIRNNDVHQKQQNEDETTDLADAFP
jgi:hypothetical protein